MIAIVPDYSKTDSVVVIATLGLMHRQIQLVELSEISSTGQPLWQRSEEIYAILWG
jgi:hypothetical protein